MFILSNKYKKLYEILNLEKKPLVIFDIETTGPSITTDKIIEIAYIKCWADGRVKKDDFFLNPEIEITPESSSIHEITDADVSSKPTFKEKAQEIWDIFYDCYYGGFNVIHFDLPILRREFIRIGMNFEYNYDQIIDSKEIFDYMESKNISAAYEHYCHKSFKDRHNAVTDAEVAADILYAQVLKHKEILNHKFIEHINKIDKDSYRDNANRFYWRRGETYFAFSKYKDKPLAQIVKEDPAFLEWIINSDFSDETKTIVKMALEKYNKK